MYHQKYFKLHIVQEDTLNDLKEKIKSLSKKNAKDKELVIEDIMNTIDTLK